jgi:hypothetical protein
MSDSQRTRTSATSVGVKRLFILSIAIGVLCLLLAIIGNIYVLEAFAVSDHHIEWPNTLHVYLTQAVLAGLGIFLVWLYLARIRVITYFKQTNLQTLAIHLFVLLIIVELILVAIFLITVNYPGYSDLGLLYALFNLDVEKNIPTTFSALLILAAAGAAFSCIRVDRHFYIGRLSVSYAWIAVSLTLLFMSIDEWFSLHEDAGLIVIRLGLVSPDFYGYAWTIVGGLVATVVGLAGIATFVKVFAKYPGLFRLLIVSGVLFLGGAIGMEDFQVYLRNNGVKPFSKVVLVLEELMEMVGMSVALFVFIRYHGIRIEEKQSLVASR